MTVVSVSEHDPVGVLANSEFGEATAAAADSRPIGYVVAGAARVGAASVGLAFVLGGPDQRIFEVHWLGTPWLQLVLLILTCVAELVAVRVRHGDDAVEELTLLDGVVLLNMLVLSTRESLVVTLSGILVAYSIRRRAPLKVVYNLGVYATASTIMASLLRWIMPSQGQFELRLLLAMAIATSAFVAVNLAHMAVLLRVLANARPWDVVREDAGLSLLTIIGTVGLTGTLLGLSVATPVLLPCAVLPAVALRYAYGASAAKHEERRRSARVLEYSQVLASGATREIALTAFLRMVHAEFDAAESLVLFEDGHGLGIQTRSVDPQPMMSEDYPRFIDEARARIVNSSELPSHWSSAIAAPLTVEGRRVGTVVVAKEGTRFRSSDLTALTSVLGSLSVSMQNAEHMVRVAEEASKLRGIVEQASDGIIVLGPHGVIEVWSPAMTLLTGVSADAALGARLGDVIAADDGQGHSIDPFAEGERRLSPERAHCTVDAEVIRTDGERRAARFAHAGVFAAGVLVRDVVIVRDVTAEQQVERMKSDFIATVSHELRTPLTPIKGYAGMLRKRGDAMPLEKRERALDVIVERADHLGRLVEDLLTASTITSTQEPRQAFTSEDGDLESLVNRACNNFPGADERIRVVSPESPISVVCDPTRFIQIMSNLVSNALKYSPAEQPVDVVIDHLEDRGRVTVVDRGQGIPVDQLERIFEKFHRVEDPMVMSTSGTGLGLFIARQLARAMDGELMAESSLGIGSRFSLTLPIATV